jgi:hypothetical protein
LKSVTDSLAISQLSDDGRIRREESRESPLPARLAMINSLTGWRMDMPLMTSQNIFTREQTLIG